MAESKQIAREVIGVVAIIVAILLAIIPMNALSRSFFSSFILLALIYLCWRSPLRLTRRVQVSLTVVFVLAYVGLVASLFILEPTAADAPVAMPSRLSLWAKGLVLAVWDLPWRWLILGAGLYAFVMAIIARLRQRKQFKCPDERLHKIAENDRALIKDLVRVPGILYEPHFEKAYIDFVFSVFNNSLYDIVIDNTAVGTIRYGEDNDVFDYPLKFQTDKPIYCASRSGASFVIRQPVRAEEIPRFRDLENVLIWFHDLQLTFRGTDQFPAIESTRLNTQYYLETKKRIWRNWDALEFIFGYTAEQWDTISKSTTQETATLMRAKIVSLKSQLEAIKEIPDEVLTIRKKGNVQPEIECTDCYFVQETLGGWNRLTTDQGGKTCMVAQADFHLKPIAESIPSIEIRSQLEFYNSDCNRLKRVKDGVWREQGNWIQMPFSIGDTFRFVIALELSDGFNTYEYSQHQLNRRRINVEGIFTSILAPNLTPLDGNTLFVGVRLIGIYSSELRLDQEFWFSLSRPELLIQQISPPCEAMPKEL